MEIRRADARLRTVAIALMMAALVAGVAVLLMLGQWRAELDALIAAFVWVTGGLCVATAGFAAWLWRFGTSVRRAAQFPPPGMRVIRDTPVLRGDAALGRARLMQSLAAALMLGAAGLAVLGWRIYQWVARGGF